MLVAVVVVVDIVVVVVVGVGVLVGLNLVVQLGSRPKLTLNLHLTPNNLWLLTK